MNLLSQITPAPIPWPVTGAWLLGLIGVLSTVYLVFGVAQQCRRLFAKHPPVSDELIRIDQELRRELARATQDCERRHMHLQTQFDERLRDLAIERARSLSELHEKINSVVEDVAFIRGKLAKDS